MPSYEKLLKDIEKSVNVFSTRRRRKKKKGERHRSKKKKAEHKRTKKKKLKGPRVIKVVNYQSGKRASLKADRKRKALKPGKRISRTGKIYWETRRNRSDLHGRV